MVTNVDTTPISISKELPLITVNDVKNLDNLRMWFLSKALPQSYAGDERPTLSVPERQANSRESTQHDNADEANIGQLSISEKQALVGVLEEYADVCAANPQVVALVTGPLLKLELRDPNRAPYVALICHYILLSSER